MNRDIKNIREELKKDIIDPKKCLTLIDRIEDELDIIDSNNIDLEDEIDDIKNLNELMRCDIIEYKKIISNNSGVDSEFKKEIFIQLSNRYTWYQLEEKLKEHKIL
jgi:hypothetical protein